jgi:hypothetical protein
MTEEGITAGEIRRIKNLSVALIEALQLSLQAVVNYSKQYDVPLPRNIPYLVSEATRLIREFNQPDISDDWKHPKTPDGEGTVPQENPRDLYQESCGGPYPDNQGDCSVLFQEDSWIQYTTARQQP